MGDVAGGALAGPPRLLVVSGLRAEARIAAGPRTLTFCSGGFAARLEAEIAAALQDGAAGVLSFGVAGGLAPGLAPGAIVLGNRIVSEGENFACDPGWLQTLAGRLPRAARGAIFGSDAPVAHAAQKAELAARTGALAVDMESHFAARWAARYGAPFVAIRVVADPVGRSLPSAALAGMRDDGTADMSAVIRSLAAEPAQLPLLMRTALDAKRAFDGLKACRRALGDDFGFSARATPLGECACA